ncbi:hypothetical protein 2050HW_00195 [Serratia phage vB_SmaM_ 2050HW]|uniref:Uncharacterized protein n=1 Tax=Serratia phage vB_SmaM_ 2050HW TaxID=2024252 RepID=A0A289ZVZ1_9CAUD|nr:hypothetical protein HWB23_gp195 [Serratia phage vB_SmaM_ 2050HW]ATA65530.1 hypothetical protein 2050HW_00195 [Serratia phage vB_SmaM_ 2050HW]URG14049.1 hypothetical protein [Pectobacterium phage vB_ParM-25]
MKKLIIGVVALMLAVSFSISFSYAKDPVVFREGYIFEAIFTGDVVHVKTFDSGVNCTYDSRVDNVDEFEGKYYTMRYSCWIIPAKHFNSVHLTYYYDSDTFNLIYRRNSKGEIIYEGIWDAKDVLDVRQ